MPFKEFTTKNFLGRNSEIEGLQGVAAEAAYGDASSVLMYGKRGVGKTELLKHLYNRLFNHQNDAIPFFYTIKTPFASLEDFSKDYLSSFVLQSLAFLHKDMSLIHSGLYSFDDLIYIAHKVEAQWAVDIIDKYLQYRDDGNTLRMFSHSIAAPYINYKKTDRAAVVLIDDFHKIGKFCELNLEGGSSNLWMLLESAVSSQHTPHIIAGCQSELQKMFFEETSIGNSFELMNLQSLAAHESILLFKLLGEIHNVNIDMELSGYIDFLNGNPFYIKSFMQSARQSCSTMSEDDFWQIYLNEIMQGKIYTYWTSLMKSYVPQFKLRKPSLKLLHNLSSQDSEPDFAAYSEQLSINNEDLDTIINMLQASGTIETGFSTFGIADDEVLADVLRVLYYTEIERQPVSRVRDLIMEGKHQGQKLASVPSFDLSIPSIPKAELVAVKSLDQAAQFFNVPSESIAHMQLALIELFTRTLVNNQSLTDRYNIKYYFKDGLFSVEVITSQVDFKIMADEAEQVKAYLDDMKIEKIMNGTRITLIKGLKEDLESASQLN